MAVKNSWTSDAHWISDAHGGSGSPLPEAFPDGAEVFGGLDGEDDAGDEEEGTPPQAEPEGILDGSHEVSSPGWATVPSHQPCAQRLCTDSTRLASRPPTAPVHWAL